MTSSKKETPPAADPRAGRNPGYAENQPRDKGDAHAPHREPPVPNPDEPGIERDTDDTPDPARKEK
jgi:hypothetical protein